ncbi:MAG: triose-phosphate isomerase [Patescibacteria group bacterium]|jgi:triosephosphate isomerase
MRQPPLIIGNWKMNLLQEETRDLASGLKAEVGDAKLRTRIIVCPSFPYLKTVQEVLAGSSISLGGQDVFWEDHGAYTGEVSAPMLRELGCTHVIVGHSERRHTLGETDRMVKQKMRNVLRAGLVPIVCVGETFEQRQQGSKELVVMRQMQAVLEGLIPTEHETIIIAYEPIWAVGTGQACDPKEAQETVQVLFHTLIDLYHETIARKNFQIVYGGSVDETNITSYLAEEEMSGVLVGGASNNIEKFVGIIKAAASG